jgi:hypothetical protein
MGFGVQKDGRIIHCGNAVAGMGSLDRRIYDNELREKAGFPPLHDFTAEEQRLIRERAAERDKNAALSLQRSREVWQRRKRLGPAGEFATRALHKTHYVTGIGFGAMAALYMEGSMLQKLAAGFFAFWPGCIPGVFLGPRILHALKLEE